MHYGTVTPFEQWMRDNVYGKMALSPEIKELVASAFEGGQKSVKWQHFDEAYMKACKSSQPQDWMDAALLAQQVRNGR